jgi:hypothetical protein
MSVLTTVCPHCGADPVPLTVRRAWEKGTHQVTVAADCPKCTMPCVMVLVPGSNRRATTQWFSTTDAYGNIDLLTQSGWEVFAKFPDPQTIPVPQFTPPDIGRLYLQAHSAKNRNEREAAGFIFGKVLEVSLKTIGPELNGTAASRIDALADSGRLSSDVQKWAHEVRIVRNDAVHEIAEPSEADITEMAEFVEAFLVFVFTMPKKYELRASRKKSAG